jgi:DNA-directed RNA polymerase subunit RPC12/RpoP
MVNPNLLLSTCRRCGKKQLSANMRLSPDGKGMVCRECLGQDMQAHIKAPKKPIFTPDAPQKKQQSSKEEMIKYRCQSCNYAFERRKGVKMAKCPYCGKASLILESRLASDSLIDESQDPRYESYSKDF